MWQRKLRIINTIALAVFVGLSEGCSMQTATEQSTPLTPQTAASVTGNVNVWSWNVAAESLMGISPAYELGHPHVKVSVDMTGANMQMRLMLSLAAGTGAPDISQLALTDAPRYISTGQLTDLTPVAAKYAPDFPPSLWRNCVSRGHVYAIPWDMGPCAVYYKRSIFAKYNIDPEKIVTWDDYITVGKKILTLSHGSTKMLALSPTDLAQLFGVLLQQTGGQIFDDEGRIAINSSQSQEAVDIIKRLLTSGITTNVSGYSEEWMAGLNDDSIASYPGAVWLGGIIKDTTNDGPQHNSVWGVFRLPAVRAGGLRVANNGGSVLVIPRQSQHKEAAWSFIEWALCTKEGQIAQYEKESLFPAYLPAMHSVAVTGPQTFFGGQRVGALFGTDVTRIPAVIMTPQTQECGDYVAQALSHWYATGMNDPNLLQDLASKLSERLDVPIANGASS